MTQGDPLSPTIFNMVVDAVVRNCVTLVIAGTKERGERVHEGRNQAALFYADYGVVASSEPRWIQGAFNTPACLFGRVVLQTNVGNTVGMVCRPCLASLNQLETEFGRRITCEGAT